MKRFQNKPSDKEITTMFRVPNNAKGRRFLELLRYYSTSGTRVWARGRGPRAVHSRKANPNGYARGYDQALPIKLAENLAIYVWKPAFHVIPKKVVREMQQEHARQLFEVTDKLDKEIQRLERDRGELMLQREAIRTQRDRFHSDLNAVVRQRDEYREQYESLVLELDELKRRAAPTKIVSINIENLFVRSGEA